MTEPADLRLLPFEHLIGLVAIGSSSLDHAVRYLHALTLVDVEAQAPNDATIADIMDLQTSSGRLARAAREEWREYLADGLLTTDEVAAGVAWTRQTEKLLGRRDRVIHALWKTDPSVPEGLTGRHLRSGRTVPDIDGIRELAEDIRRHLNDERGTVIALALLKLRGIEMPVD